MVDQVDIDGKNGCLPREISELVDGSEKSAEVVVLMDLMRIANTIPSECKRIRKD